jgi:hypothetical protein
MDILEAANWDSDYDESFFSEIDAIRENAVKEFTFERMRSYYIGHPDICKPVLRRLDESKTLLSTNNAASLIFSLSASEVCLKALIMRPMVYGFVHQVYIADIVAGLVVSHMGWDRFKKLLDHILKVKLGIDLEVMNYRGRKINMWSQFNDLVKIRNDVLHKIHDSDRLQAELSLELADQLCNFLFPELLSNFSLRMDEYGTISEVSAS